MLGGGERPSGRERFELAASAGPADGGRRADLDILRSLAEASVDRIGEVPYGSNAVFILELATADPEIPDEPMRAVYKPARGERPLWDFPRHTLYLREAATYLVDAALDLGYVPPTTLRDGPLGPGSVQLYVHAAERRPAAKETERLEGHLRSVAALDVLVNNADRKRSHLMLTRGIRLRAIDNALTFLPYPRQRTALLSLGGSPLTAGFTKRLRALRDDSVELSMLRARLTRMLSEAEVEAFGRRVIELADDPTYPVLDDWDGRPFDWW